MGTNKTLEPQGLSPTVPNFPTIPSPREREKKYIQSLPLAGLNLSHRFHNAEIGKGLRCLGEKTHRLTGAGDKKLKAPSKNFYVPIYVPKLKARFYLIVFKRFTNPLTEFHPDVRMDVRVSFFRTFRSPRNRNFLHSFQLSNFGSQRSFFRTLQPSGLEIRLD